MTSGFGTTKRLLTGMLHLSATEAGTWVAHAAQLASRRVMSGEPLAPQLPNTAGALAAGEIGPAQVRVIVETMNAIPASVSVAEREAVEAELARYAPSGYCGTLTNRYGRTGGAKCRELDVTNVERLKNVGDVEFMDSAGRAGHAASATTHTTTSDNTSHITMCD